MKTFFEKKMSAKTVIHNDSALPENSKMASLSQNVVRHMRNTSEGFGMQERVAVVNKFTLENGPLRLFQAVGQESDFLWSQGV